MRIVWGKFCDGSHVSVSKDVSVTSASVDVDDGGGGFFAAGGSFVLSCLRRLTVAASDGTNVYTTGFSS